MKDVKMKIGSEEVTVTSFDWTYKPNKMNDTVETVPEILDSNAELFRTKNEDYGNSRQLSGEIVDMMIQGELTLNSHREHSIYGLQTRLMDKLIRAFHLQWNADDENHESLVDTYKDLSNYAAMLAHEEQVRNNESMSLEDRIKDVNDVKDVS